MMARGNRKQVIFTDDRDRRAFLKIVAVGLQKYGVECFAYILMGNHFHKVLHTPRANISQVMHHIDRLYAQYVNWRHGTTGRLFEAPFKAILIDDTDYLRTAIAYILRNPVAASLVSDAGRWPWSSFRASMGTGAPGFVTLTWLPRLFPAESLGESRQLLAEAVRNEPQQYADLVRSVAEGSQEFKKRVRQVIGATLYGAAVPRSYRALARPPLSEVFAGMRRNERRQTIVRAHIVHGYLLTEIANYLELHPTTISRIVNQRETGRLARD